MFRCMHDNTIHIGKENTAATEPYRSSIFTSPSTSFGAGLPLDPSSLCGGGAGLAAATALAASAAAAFSLSTFAFSISCWSRMMSPVPIFPKCCRY